MRAILLATAALGLAAAAPTPVLATPLTGMFTITAYQGRGDGTSTAAIEQANRSNPLFNTTPVLTFTYTGALNFNSPTQATDTFAGFIGSGGGVTSVSLPNGPCNGNSANCLSTGTFDRTTLFDITGNTGGLNLAGTVSHDDGASLYQGSSTIFSSPAPTQQIGTAYTLLAGTFELVYIAANGAPSVLDFDVASSSQPIPEPASMALLGTGLIGIGMIARRRKAA